MKNAWFLATKNSGTHPCNSNIQYYFCKDDSAKCKRRDKAIIGEYLAVGFLVPGKLEQLL